MTSDEIARLKLSTLGFKRWRMIMRGVRKNEKLQRYYQEQLGLIQRENNRLFEEMQALWANERRTCLNS